MINVGFTVIGSQGWIAGTHYLRNLLYAISILDGREIKPLLFTGEKTSDGIIKQFSPYAKVVTAPILDRKPIPWAIYRHRLNSLMKKNGISVLSHSGISGHWLPYKTINWIPDFQHLHLPGMFSKAEIKLRNRYFIRTIKKSDHIIVSSHDAMDDFRKFAPDYTHKASVLQFVSQPDKRIFELDTKAEMERKYNFTGKFFFLPNQLWKHKNHGVVFEATRLLKEKGSEILILCSGHMRDYRHKGYIEEMQNHIRDNKLENNIRLLGLIDYEDVLYLMRNSISVINPSLFEGWSTTVEEAKSIGKNIILSDIRVHREQAPPRGVYFDPQRPKELADILLKRWNESEGGPDLELEEKARLDLEARTKQFASQYQNIVRKCLSP